MTAKFLGSILRLFGRDVYAQDGLITVHNHAFMEDQAFQLAYQRGVKSGKVDYHFEWRVHVALWAASVAKSLRGDFVECGVNKGFLSSAIMQHLGWNDLDKTFYLLDTFAGPAEELLSEAERKAGYAERSKRGSDIGFYAQTVKDVQENFKEWTRVRIVQGTIPETLHLVDAESVSFLHIDLNCSQPEIAALDHFWPRITPGGMILLDDYAYVGFRLSKEAMDALAAKHSFKILSIPTGQGLIVKTA